MKSIDHGWSNQRKSSVKALALTMTFLFASSVSFASSLTVREIALNANQIEIQLDGVTPKGAIDLDYVRDIVQFSIPNATIYPAKILHAEKDQAFSKVFAYQYSPNLVRVRFSVDGKAEDLKGKVKWKQNGKSILVSFPAGSIAKNSDESDEKSLLAKVLNSAKKDDVKVEAISANEAKTEPKQTAESKAEARAEAKVEAKAEKSENKSSRRLTGNGDAPVKASTKLGGQSSGPSGLRSFFSLALVIGGLGLVLLYVKKRKGGSQAKKVGDSWLSGILPNGMKKQKSFIEVVATHSLGPKHSITVVKIKGQQFVLAVTPENVQMITQLDSDDTELDLLEDPTIAASLGRMFGGKTPVAQAPIVASPKANAAPISAAPKVQTGTSFDTMLKNSNGAGAIVARNAYAAQGQGLTQQVPAIQAQKAMIQSNGVRDQIRKRLEGMKNA